jgi:hypothetical protein
MTRDEFIQECLEFHPALREQPDYGIVCSLTSMRDLLHTISTKKKPLRVSREVLFDALAELIPEQREFWLRCEATDRERFIGGMTALMSTPESPTPGTHEHRS